MKVESERGKQMHIPVALERCIDLLTPSIERAISSRGESVVVDATLGLGGHSRALLERFPQLTIIGLDRDLSAIAIAKVNTKEFADRITIVHSVYDQMDSVLHDLGLDYVDGILFDLGVSSMQLDESERGFAYSQEAPLDMRMDQSQGMSALDVLTTYDRSSLIRILRQYGEEKFAPRIADNIIAARTAGTLQTTTQLADLVKESIPAPARRTGGNPAKRTFQALRIEVNGELEVLERAIPAALELIRPGGRVVSMAYQSLEDKVVKREFMRLTQSTTPRGLPVELPSDRPSYVLVFAGSEAASDLEISENPRAASMRLRAIERLAS